jgi:hypothetical protein
MNRMETVLWVLLPGFVAVASGLLVWFVMESRFEVRLAQEREVLAEERGAIDAQKAALGATLEPTVRAAEESARRAALDGFLGELRVEQRHYTRENRLLTQSRKALVLQERMYFRNIPLSDWIEHEIVVEDGVDVERLVQNMTVFDKPILNIADIQRPRKALA